MQLILVCSLGYGDISLNSCDKKHSPCAYCLLFDETTFVIKALSLFISTMISFVNMQCLVYTLSNCIASMSLTLAFSVSRLLAVSHCPVFARHIFYQVVGLYLIQIIFYPYLVLSNSEIQNRSFNYRYVHAETRYNMINA